ncbi:unnamed protein product [Penicillium manginii]
MMRSRLKWVNFESGSSRDTSIDSIVLPNDSGTCKRWKTRFPTLPGSPELGIPGRAVWEMKEMHEE